MTKHASDYVEDEDHEVAALLACIRPYRVDTTEARFRQDDARTTGQFLLPENSGRLGTKLRRFAHELGWATEQYGDQVVLERGEGVDPARDSLLALTERESSNFHRDNRRWTSEDELLQDGARTTVRPHGHDYPQEGVLASAEDLEAGDDVYVQYREMRDAGGYSYSASAQEFTATVEATSEDAVDLGDSGSLDLGQEYEGRATWQTPDGDTRAVKHLVRLD